MPDERILREETDKVLAAMEIHLIAQAQRTAITIEELIETALLQGVDREALRQQLIGDLLEGGRIFGEFRRAVKATANGTTNRLRDAGEFSELGTEITYRWVAILVNTCQDCLDRHNTGGLTYEEWESAGLPRTGQTICKQNCRCVLIPEQKIDIEPIRRARGRR